MTEENVKITEVAPGDVVRFPGHLAHEDLAGLMIEERVEGPPPPASYSGGCRD